MKEERVVITNIYYGKEDVKEITLLTVEQAKKISYKTLSCGKWWWLRSPGNDPSSAADVSSDGDVLEDGNYVGVDRTAVRPAFVISNLKEVNGKIYVGKIPCTQIDENLVLADKPLCSHCFDPTLNDWETSELKRFIESSEFWDRYIEGGE